MLDLSSIHRCADITEAHVIQAARSREQMRELLMHAAKISRPGEGAAKVMLALARMAMSSSDWVEGDLRADLRANGDRIDVDVKSVSGGVIERVFPTFTLDAPLEELMRAVQMVPNMIDPLFMHAPSAEHVVLVSSEELYDELPPESVEIGEAEHDFTSLNITVGEVIPESEVERPVLKGARPALANDDVHTRKTVQRMAAIRPEALRSEPPPPTTRKAPPSTVRNPNPAGQPSSTDGRVSVSQNKPAAEGDPPKKDEDFDEGWE
jgi:hypothetical protein